MAFLDKSKANYAFKVLLGRGHTDNARELANEPYASSITLAAKGIWADSINPVPGHASNTGIVSDLVTLSLEPVAGSSVSYIAKISNSVPVSLVGKINPITNAPYAVGDRVGNIIPKSFGEDFRPVLKKAGVEVPPLDASDWFLDPFAGIVTQESDGDSPNLALGATGTLECYIYIGRLLSDRLDALETQLESISAGEATSSEFIGLTDTPSSYSGQAGNLVQVNPAETGLQFTNFVSGSILCNTTTQTYTVSHAKIFNTSNPIVTLVAPSLTSASFTATVHDVVNGGFTVVLSGTPDEAGFKINWLIL